MENIITKYKEKGLRLTPQRIAILKYLDGNTGHPTADNIYRDIKRRYPTLSFATVYNTLQTLKEHGGIMEITIDSMRKHYDPNTTPHHHIICVDCNEIWDVFEDYSKVLRLPPHLTREVRIAGAHVDFYGLCRKCQKRKGVKM
ncbi:MAG: transcriptional repressor [Nitrospirae bacterium]|nr:transcriptional repressor [Nitrospirota bacterium]